MTSGTADPDTTGAGSSVGAASLSAGDAFGLGWQMAELRNYAPSTAADDDGGELPGLSRLQKRCTNTSVLLSQLNAGIARLRDAVPADARPALETGRSDVVAAFTAICERPAEPGGSGEPPERQTFPDRVEALHEAVVAGLLGADYKLAKAYTLGTKLAWITQAPAQGWNTAAADDGRPTTLGQGKLGSARKHLTDLGTVLPQHSSRAVQLSAGAWAEWARVESDSTPGERPAPGEPERSVEAAGELARQGEIWRSLLTGEKDATDMLATRDYERAAQLMFEQTKQIARRFVTDHLPAVLLLILIVVGAVAGLIVANATSQVIAALGVLLASAGVTWKAATATLGDMAQRLGTPMWGAQLDRTIAEAITTLPDPGVQELAVMWAAAEAQGQRKRTPRRAPDPRALWWQHIADGQRPSGPAPKARHSVLAAQPETRRRLRTSLGRLRHPRRSRERRKTTAGRRS